MDDKPDPLAATVGEGERPTANVGERPTASVRAAGSVVAHYRLGEQLGEGGMGVVYRAQDLKLGRAVAIKFMARTDDQSRARFLREARAASALDHRNIGTVYEIGEADGAPFIVMALYEGETLRARIQRASIPVEEVVAIARQLCTALTAAHGAGIVHRDLKPANVMVLADGTVKLLDFGLAKLVSIDESSLTREGAILGTLAYMAPEQLKSAEVDVRADLWALGAVLYEMLSGQPPFGIAPAATVVGRILAERPTPLPAGTPRDLGAITLRLLQKTPPDRLSSAALVDELLSQRKAPRVRSRGRMWWAVAGASIVATTTGVVVLRERALTVYQRYLQEPGDKLHIAELEAPSPSPASDMLRAQQLYDSAVAKFRRQDFEGAARDTEEAYALTRDPTLLYNAAQSFRLNRQYSRALIFYESFVKAAPDAEARRDAKARIDEMRRAIH